MGFEVGVALGIMFLIITVLSFWRHDRGSVGDNDGEGDASKHGKTQSGGR